MSTAFYVPPELRRTLKLRKKRRRKLHDMNPHCAYCGVPVAFENSTLDHIHPVCQGGGDAPDNLVLCCQPCNVAKAGRRPDQWIGAILRVAILAAVNCTEGGAA